MLACQWHLDNSGRDQGTTGEEINVADVRAGDTLKKCIVVAVVDDGVDPGDEDLTDNVDEDMSHVYRGKDLLVPPMKPTAPR